MEPESTPLVSIIIPTYNRLAFLQQAVSAVLEQSDLPYELLIWDNASTDGTGNWLRTLTDPHVRVIHHPENIGCNAYEYVFSQYAGGDWLVQMDNDVLQLPPQFLSRMKAAFDACADLGYVALDVVRDDKTNGNKPEEYAYAEETYGGITLQFGPVGGWCTMTPRHIYEMARFPIVEGKTYFYHDGMYNERIRKLGRRAAILKDVRCYHAVGVWWNAQYADYWTEAHANDPKALQNMKSFLERGVFTKDCQRPFSVRKCLGDAKRFMQRNLFHRVKG
jgi:glycosyltransferase involved in cell wall biosynthesis